MNKFIWLMIPVLILSCNQKQDVYIPETKGNIIFFNGLAESLSIIDISTDTVYNDVKTTGMWPNNMTLNTNIFLVNSGDNSISIYDPENLNLLKEIYLGTGKNPWMSFHIPNSNYLYVSCYLSDEVIKVNTNSGESIKTLTVGKNPEGGCIVDNRLFIGNTGSDSISVIDISADSIEETIDLKTYSSKENLNPQSIIPFPDREEIHVISTGANIVIVFNSTTLKYKTTINVGGSPIYSEGNINYDKELVYLHGTRGISAYNYQSHEVTDSIGGLDKTFISGLTFIPSKNKLYASDFSNDKIYIIDGDSYINEKTLEASDGVQQLLYIK